MGFVKVPRHASNKNIILRECAPVPNLYTCVESYVLDAHCLIDEYWLFCIQLLAFRFFFLITPLRNKLSCQLFRALR